MMPRPFTLLSMSLWLLLLAQAQAEPAPPRVVVVPEGEVLPSESRALAALKGKLGKGASAPVLAEATATETAFARASFKGEAPALPKEWGAAQTVVVLQLLSPSGKKPKRVSRGVGSILIFRPPQQKPVYSEVVSVDEGSPLTNEALAGWISRAAAIVAGTEVK